MGQIDLDDEFALGVVGLQQPISAAGSAEAEAPRIKSWRELSGLRHAGDLPQDRAVVDAAFPGRRARNPLRRRVFPLVGPNVGGLHGHPDRHAGP